MNDDRHRLASTLGCLLGGAAGDALGAPIEFLRWDEIKASYGPAGIAAYPSGVGYITDDTQMTIATARALSASADALRAGNSAAVVAALHQEYLAWRATQDDPAQRRGPGATCLTALASGKRGSPENPINNSKGCGGVMRVAPVGLALPGQPGQAFALGMASAAITHGHPGGYRPAGFLAALIATLPAAEGLRETVASLLGRCELDDDTRRLVGMAVTLAGRCASPGEAWETLGEGWTGDEALAIAIYAALRHPTDVGAALALAVNHSGDSDSTGCICGAILGAALGIAAIPHRLLAHLERRPELVQLAASLAQI